MVQIVTYDTLIADLKAYSQRGQSPSDQRVIDQLPRIVMMGHERLVRELPTLISQEATTTTLIAGNPILAKPSRWRFTKMFCIGIGAGFNRVKELYERDPTYLRQRFTNPMTTNEPKFYADYDMQHWLIAPTPTLAHPVELLLDMDPAPLGPTQQTNAYTQQAPDLITHSCMLELALFLKNPAFIASEQATYDRLLKGYEYEDQNQKTDKAETR